jgi:hypothetical protein
VKFIGVDTLHAAFFNESRTRSRLLGSVQEIRGSTVKLLFPIHWDSTPRSWSGLAQGVGMWRREPLAFDLAVALEVPKPRFTGFKALHDGMAGGVEMLARMLGRRAIAAADVPAFRTTAKMKPPAASGQTIYASSSTGRHRRINTRDMFAHLYLPA